MAIKKCLSLMPNCCGIKFQFSHFLHLFNLSSASVTSVRPNSEQMESGSMYIDDMPK